VRKEEGRKIVGDDGNMEFRRSLGRLYDDCLALKEATANLADAAKAHQHIAEAHERRLDKLEVVRQWPAEKECAREKGLES
jgi:hypothetical protein